MIISELTAFLTLLSGLLAVLITLRKQIKELWREDLIPIWHKMKIPGTRFLIMLVTLFLPNGLIIALFLFYVATDYWQAGRLDYILTNKRVFLQLVGWQAAVVSGYSYLWMKIIYPSLCTLVDRWKAETRTRPVRAGQRRNDSDDMAQANVVQPTSVAPAQTIQPSNEKGES